ncbi:hypothetical protein AADZ90_018730 [Aestuariibius sp. 2305UL40-4]|uniref:hypothetical protein n=1 Tax=Aestuariibius violaceus TaxID=3234132 RepID=UPI00345E8194
MAKTIILIAGAGIFTVVGAVGLTQVHKIIQPNTAVTSAPVAQSVEPPKRPVVAPAVESPVQTATDAPPADLSPAEDVALTEPTTVSPTAPDDSIAVAPAAKAPQTPSDILREAGVETYVPGIEEERNTFVAEPSVSRVPLDAPQQETSDPVTSIVRDDRPADDRRIKRTWSVGVYR